MEETGGMGWCWQGLDQPGITTKAAWKDVPCPEQASRENVTGLGKVLPAQEACPHPCRVVHMRPHASACVCALWAEYWAGRASQGVGTFL